MTDLKDLREKAARANVQMTNMTAGSSIDDMLRLASAANPQAILELLDRLEKAEAVIQFYSEEKNWGRRTSGHGDSSRDVINDDGGWSDCAGKRAREYFKEVAK